jgi:Fe2+ transport system protein FeoA
VEKAATTPPAAEAPAELYKLSEVQAGVLVTIKQLSASPEVSTRLRELGFCEEQRIKLLSRNSNLICQVCNARLGLSSQLAGLIWVEKVKPQRLAA